MLCTLFGSVSMLLLIGYTFICFQAGTSDLAINGDGCSDATPPAAAPSDAPAGHADATSSSRAGSSEGAADELGMAGEALGIAVTTYAGGPRPPPRPSRSQHARVRPPPAPASSRPYLKGRCHANALFSCHRLGWPADSKCLHRTPRT